MKNLHDVSFWTFLVYEVSQVVICERVLAAPAHKSKGDGERNNHVWGQNDSLDTSFNIFHPVI